MKHLIGFTYYNEYPKSRACLHWSNKLPCKRCQCFGGFKGDNILCTENWKGETK